MVLLRLRMMIILLFLFLPAYLLVQTMAIIRLRSGWRWACALPVIPMVYMLVISGLAAGASGGDWPLMGLFLISPVSLSYVVCVWGLNILFKKAFQKKTLP